MKDSKQVTINQYDGTARPGELIVDQIEKTLYIGQDDGSVVQFTGSSTGVTSTLVDPAPIAGNYLTIALGTYAQAVVTGNITANCTVNLQSDEFVTIPAGENKTGSATVIFTNNGSNTFGITGLRASGTWGGGDVIIGGGPAPAGKSVLAQINILLQGDGTASPPAIGYITYTQID
jgi:hypothetical protein